jgi:hypothetical protein
MRQAPLGQSDTHHQTVAVLDHPRPHPQPLQRPEHRVVLRLHHAHDPVGAEHPRLADNLAEQPQPQALSLPAVLD